ncbi:ATPase [Rugosimonospora africana]|uniref:ATPase n=2 Tax=Rugosimonospora africana TaxID=556532 RepID=A0A8J3R027_9ACTN|nr:ATPase [Rugosimonospora africana]
MEEIVTRQAAPSYIAIDLGKTHCRVKLRRASTTTELRGAGFPGFAAAGNVNLALDAIQPLVSTIMDEGPDIVGLGAGAAGVESNPDAAREAAQRIRSLWGFDVVIASDVLTAHIGAFGAGPGTVLVAGTGSVAYRVDADGTVSRSDGWGPWLGDEGSGRWIGQAGLACALRSADRRGPHTSLEDDARAIAGDIRHVPHAVTGGTDVARALASFAPVVLARATAGDVVAGGIVRKAARRLAQTASSIADPRLPVSVVGGLTNDTSFLRLLLNELALRDLTTRRPAGTSLDGAEMLAAHRDLPHEKHAIRV